MPPEPVATSARDTTIIPIDVLWGDPERGAPALSPDGRRLAYTEPRDGVMNLVVSDISGGEVRQVTFARERGIEGATWAHDGRHLLYLRDRDGDENTHLHAVEIEGGEVRDLTPFEGVQARLVALSPTRPDTVAVALNRDDPSRHDLYRVTITSGALELVGADATIARWILDIDLRVLAAVRLTDDSAAILVRDAETAPWRTVFEATPAEEDVIGLAVIGHISLTADRRAIHVVSARGSDTTRLLRIDLADGTTSVVYQDTVADIDTVYLHPLTREPQMVSTTPDRVRLVAVDPAVTRDVETIARDLPGDLEPRGGIQRDLSDRTWLLRSVDASGPCAIYLHDRPSGTVRHLHDERPALRRHRLGTTEPFTLSSRDGLVLHGYLTFPPDRPRLGLPTVVKVHGGPYGRDHWHDSFEYTQLLATRGYLVIRVNYRGSSGYGRRFLAAGIHEWAGRMHTDVLDALEWAVAHGYADRDRVAIMGGSYGGYEALVGVTFTPDVFHCAVSMYGMCNLQTLMASIPPYWVAERRYLVEHAGDPHTEADLLWDRSPLRLVDNIRVPLLLLYGRNDPRVKIAEAEQIVGALRERGIPHQYVCFDNEGHGWSTPEAQHQSLELIERFLADHLGGAVG